MLVGLCVLPIAAGWALRDEPALVGALDPGFPAERLAYMLEDAGVTLIVTTSDLVDALREEADAGRLRNPTQALLYPGVALLEFCPRGRAYGRDRVRVFHTFRRQLAIGLHRGRRLAFARVLAHNGIARPE